MSKRLFNLYEKNQLLKYGLDPRLPDSDFTPVEYLTGHVDFVGHDFLVNPHVLIPRIETAEILSLVTPKAGDKILDLGTGSGALGISLSLKLLDQKIPHQLFLSDISTSALQVAQQNAVRLLPKSNQPTLIHSDLFKNFPPIKFDLVVANLPYIPTARISTLDPSVKDHEPITALDGGPTGAEIINRFFHQLPAFISPQAVIILEIDHTHTFDSFSIPSQLKAQILPDQFGHTRFLLFKNH